MMSEVYCFIYFQQLLFYAHFWGFLISANANVLSSPYCPGLKESKVYVMFLVTYMATANEWVRETRKPVQRGQRTKLQSLSVGLINSYTLNET